MADGIRYKPLPTGPKRRELVFVNGSLLGQTIIFLVAVALVCLAGLGIVSI